MFCFGLTCVCLNLVFGNLFYVLKYMFSFVLFWIVFVQINFVKFAPE